MRDRTTIPLYDTLDGWRNTPMEAFRGFVLTESYLKSGRRNPTSKAGNGARELRPLRASTCAVLCQMFGKIDSWLTLNRKMLLELTSADILTFLDAKVAKRPGKGETDMTSSIRMRYIRLLERIYNHLGIAKNPAAKAALTLSGNVLPGAAGLDKPTIILSRSEEQAFTAALSRLPIDAEQSWTHRRNQAMLAIMLGAGLKVSEVMGLYRENIGKPEKNGSIRISVVPAAASGTSLEHDVDLEPPYAQYLTQWLEERPRLLQAGPLLFPATELGQRISNATLYRQVKAAFERAGLDSLHQGGRTLRNTFAVRQLANGASLEDLKRLMGHRNLKTTAIFAPLVKRYQSTSKPTRKR
jgi:integrase/recombinase XerD